MDLSDCEAILVYIASCRTARVIQRDPVSNKKKKEGRKKGKERTLTHILGVHMCSCAHVFPLYVHMSREDLRRFFPLADSLGDSANNTLQLHAKLLYKAQEIMFLEDLGNLSLIVL